jgi:hypothetical protein
MVIASCMLAILTACAPSANVPLARTQFDGTYAGESTLTGGFGYICGAPRSPVAVSIKDGRFDYVVPVIPMGDPVVSVQIRADGTLAGQALYLADALPIRGPEYRPAWAMITGHIDGLALNAQVRDFHCVRHMVLHRG